MAQNLEILNQDSIVRQGEILLIKITDNSYQTESLGINALNRTYRFNNSGLVVIGIGLRQEPRPEELTLIELESKKHLYSAFFYILPRDLVKPGKIKMLKRLSKKEQERKNKLVATANAIKSIAYNLGNYEEDYTDGEYVYPLQYMYQTDAFGSIRRYKIQGSNVVTSRFHEGVDLKTGDKKGYKKPVMAINSGRVILTGDFVADGKIIIIDHGLGVFSLYLHLSNFKIESGDLVSKGQIIALSGATPSGTPPHLDWRIKISSEYVDPLRFIDIMNQYLK